MSTLLSIIHVVVSVFLILVVLLQSGRGGGMGAAFGGASGQIFGGRGAGSFLSRLTTGAAVVFFCTSLTLSMMSSRHRSVLMNSKAPATAPADGEDAEGGATDSAEGSKKDAKPSTAPSAAPDSMAKPGAAGEPAKHPDAPAPTPPGVPTGK